MLNKCFLSLLQELALWTLDGKETKDQACLPADPLKIKTFVAGPLQEDETIDFFLSLREIIHKML